MRTWREPSNGDRASVGDKLDVVSLSSFLPDLFLGKEPSKSNQNQVSVIDGPVWMDRALKAMR